MHTFSRIVELPGGALQAVVTKSVIRGRGPAVTMRTSLPGGAEFTVIKDVAEEQTDAAWPVINELFETLSPLSVAIAFSHLLRDHRDSLNPEDQPRDVVAVEATLQAISEGMAELLAEGNE